MLIDHQSDGDQLKAIGHRFVDYIFGVTESRPALRHDRDVIAPQGKFGLIDDAEVAGRCQAEGQSASLHWEPMFTRSTFRRPT